MPNFGELKRRAIGLLEEGGGMYLNDAADGRVKEAIRTVISTEQHKAGMSFYEWEKAEKRLYYSMRGYDVIEELMEDEEVSEIMINGMESIFYEKNGVIYRYSENFESEEDLYLMIERIVSKHNRKVNLKEPIVDTKCPDGSRVHVVLPPVSVMGPVVTIRRFLNKARTLKDLIECGGISENAAEFLRDAIRNRKTLLISGGTSSGKTTLLNALIDEIDENERIITIEDSAELKLDGRENAISLECRNKTAEGINEVTLRDLIKASLRMRPEPPHYKKAKIRASKKESDHPRYTPAPLPGQWHSSHLQTDQTETASSVRFPQNALQKTGQMPQTFWLQFSQSQSHGL